ncbi:AAA family ATPase [Streptomyces javensis]|uniref:AAA family ATPase n=1 Tax=Streptomyces javensis TaxID=114698 RepID=A0ABS0R3W1_9ACTN|nr:AAA family ATPase [Streptomyces javensis]MBI0311649.1 AAA family ATPase [Streptomyces javensis]
MATAAEAPASAGGLVPHAQFQFAQAAKEARPLRALLDGPPGSGRLISALRMASALGTTIAVIDTERGRSRQYADEITFDVTEMTSFDPRDLCLALYAAASYDVVIIASWSAFWSGPEGVRDQVAHRNGKGGKDAAWDEVRPLERQMIEAVQCFPGHVVGILRNRLESVLITDAAGRTVPTRVSMRAEARDGLEYDVDFAASLLPTHELVVTKSAAPTLANEVFTDAVAVGAELRKWADEGIDRAPRVDMLHRAYDGEATYESLSQLALEIQERRAAGMAAVDHKGQLTTLGDLVSFRLSRAYARGQQANAEQRAA